MRNAQSQSPLLCCNDSRSIRISNWEALRNAEGILLSKDGTKRSLYPLFWGSTTSDIQHNNRVRLVRVNGARVLSHVHLYFDRHFWAPQPDHTFIDNLTCHLLRLQQQPADSNRSQYISQRSRAPSGHLLASRKYSPAPPQ